MAGNAAPAEGRGAGFWGDGEQHAPWEEEHWDSSLLHQSRYDGFEMDRGGGGGRSLGPSGPGPPAKRMRGAGMEGYEYGYPWPAPGGYGGREGMGGGYGEGAADFGGPPGMLPRGGPFGPPGGAMGMQHRMPNGGQGQGFAPGAGAGAGSGAGAFPPAGQGGGAELSSGAAAAAGRGGGGGGGGGGRGRGTGGIFFKTKLCSRFKSGSCPYNSNCNFAHGMEELRRPPRGWEEFAAQDGGYGGGSVTPPTPVPQGQGQGLGLGQGQGLGQGGQGLQNGLTADSLKFHKTRPCKKYFNEGNCPYGDRCNFLHDEPGPQARGARDTPVISSAAPLSPGGASSGSGGVTARPPNWKTRICNKWEVTGHCPFGDKCHFAHGSAELQSYGGGPFDSSNGGSGGGTPTEVKSSTKQWEVGMTDSQPAGTSQGLISKQGRHSVRTAAGERTKALWKESLTEICNVYADWVGVDKGKIWNENEKYSSPKLPEHMGQLVYGREEKPDVGEFCGQDGDAYLKVDGSHAFPAQRHMNGLQNGFHGVGNGVIHSLQNQVDYGYYGQEGSNYDGP